MIWKMYPIIYQYQYFLVYAPGVKAHEEMGSLEGTTVARLST